MRSWISVRDAYWMDDTKFIAFVSTRYDSNRFDSILLISNPQSTCYHRISVRDAYWMIPNLSHLFSRDMIKFDSIRFDSIRFGLIRFDLILLTSNPQSTCYHQILRRKTIFYCQLARTNDTLAGRGAPRWRLSCWLPAAKLWLLRDWTALHDSEFMANDWKVLVFTCVHSWKDLSITAKTPSLSANFCGY